jgi:hypothetical protein
MFLKHAGKFLLEYTASYPFEIKIFSDFVAIFLKGLLTCPSLWDVEGQV